MHSISVSLQRLMITLSRWKRNNRAKSKGSEIIPGKTASPESGLSHGVRGGCVRAHQKEQDVVKGRFEGLWNRYGTDSYAVPRDVKFLVMRERGCGEVGGSVKRGMVWL